MNYQRLVGVVLLVMGVAILLLALNASQSVAERFSDTITGTYTDSTTWYIIGGLGVALSGLLLTVARSGKSGA